MRLPIVIKAVTAFLLSIFAFIPAMAQLSCENPLEYAALTEGNLLINSQINSQVRGQAETAALQNTIAVEFRQIRAWEEKYSNYTQTVSGFASSLNAATHIYDDALKILLSLGELKESIAANPQGIVATMSLNSLYLETATELISCFSLIRNAVAKGGRNNMLTGVERSQILWEINDKMDVLSRKLQKLSLSIRYYTMMDVWQSYSAGMIERDNASVAGLAHDRWRRAARAVEIR